MQTINDLLDITFNAMDKYGYYHKRVIHSQGEHFVKIQLYINDNLMVQVNRNDKSNLTSMVVLKDAKRIYGRDQYQETWHRHPASDSDGQDHTVEGLKPVTLEIFLNEADHVLKQMGLV